MGYKKICLNCKLSYTRNFYNGSELNYPCPECGKNMILLPHRFRPPKKNETKKWETIKYLIEQGFVFQHIYEKVEVKNGVKISQNYAKYPDNLTDAKEFVEKYKEQSLKNK